MGVSMFCIPGKHGGPIVTTELGDKIVPTEDWRLVRARYNPKTREWFYDPESSMELCVCPNHLVNGEPGGS